MPNYKFAKTLEAKFVNYSLNQNHPSGKDKAAVYQSVLGFNSSNYKSLISQIHNKIISGKAQLTSISENPYGCIKFKYIINVVGINGRTADIVVVYGFNKSDNKPQLITNYIK